MTSTPWGGMEEERPCPCPSQPTAFEVMRSRKLATLKDQVYYRSHGCSGVEPEFEKRELADLALRKSASCSSQHGGHRNSRAVQNSARSKVKTTRLMTARKVCARSG